MHGTIFDNLLLWTSPYEYKTYNIIHNSFHNLINKIINDLSIEFPTCLKFCNLKERIVKHFLRVRSYATVTFSVNSKKERIYMA